MKSLSKFIKIFNEKSAISNIFYHLKSDKIIKALESIDYIIELVNMLKYTMDLEGHDNTRFAAPLLKLDESLTSSQKRIEKKNKLIKIYKKS